MISKWTLIAASAVFVLAVFALAVIDGANMARQDAAQNATVTHLASTR